MLRNATILVDPSTSVDVAAPSAQLPSGCCLEVARGRTRFPHRPISCERFLIGSGTECDLRLGGDGIPTLHSLIHYDGDQYWLEAVSDFPPLLVNGRREHYVALQDDDEITVGGVTFRIHMSSAVGTPSAEGEGPSIDETGDLADLSAERLVELIEHEEAMLDRFESRRELGAEALQDAARRRATVPLDEPKLLVPAETIQADEVESTERRGLIVPLSAASESQLLRDVERVVQELDAFSQDLERRSRRMTQREASYAETMATLLEIQHKLTTQLETLLERIVDAQPHHGKPVPRTRAIA